MKKVYIAGCGGMLGEAFYEAFKNDYKCRFTDKDVNSDWLDFQAQKNLLQLFSSPCVTISSSTRNIVKKVNRINIRNYQIL